MADIFAMFVIICRFWGWWDQFRSFTFCRMGEGPTSIFERDLIDRVLNDINTAMATAKHSTEPLSSLTSFRISVICLQYKQLSPIQWCDEAMWDKRGESINNSKSDTATYKKTNLAARFFDIPTAIFIPPSLFVLPYNYTTKDLPCQVLLKTVGKKLIYKK